MKYLIDVPDDLTPDSMSYLSVKDKAELTHSFKRAKLATEICVEVVPGHTGAEPVALEEVSKKPIEGIFKMYSVGA